MIGLIVLQPFADQIINKEKKIEYRSIRYPKKNMNVPVYLLSKGKVLGIVRFTDVNWFSEAKGVVYGHVIEVIKKFKTPLNYDHPNGAQTWIKDVKLKNDKMDQRSEKNRS